MFYYKNGELWQDGQSRGQLNSYAAYVAAGLLSPQERIFSFVGAGGKTSSIYALAQGIAEAGYSVAVTTTTHMYHPLEYELFAEGLSPDFCATAGSIVNYGTRGTAGKFSAPSAEVLERLPQVYDFVLIEADGARKLALKAPSNTEPVILAYTDRLIVLAGLSALGGRLGEVCHRPEIVAEILHKSLDAPIEAWDYAPILLTGYVNERLGTLSQEATTSKSLPLAFILNQVDGAAEWRAAQQIAADLPGYPLLAQSLAPPLRRRPSGP